MSKLQITLALLKPDVAVNPIAVQAIESRIVCKNLTVVARKVFNWKRKDSEKFYEQHKGKFFHQRLVEYMTCGPIVALLLVGQDAIQSWRNLMGPTKTFRANLLDPYSLRGEFGLTDTRNSAHGSDSAESVNEEIRKVFPEFDLDSWWNTGNFNICEENSLLLNPSKIEHSNSYSEGTMPFLNEELLNSKLGLHDTWSSYFKLQERDCSMEWFLKYEELQDHLHPLLHTAMKEKPSRGNTCTVLDIGCGDSMFGPNIAKQLGSEVDVYCIDFAYKALQSLQLKMNKDEEFDNIQNCSFVHCDVTQTLPFDPGSVSAVIDKGVTDSIHRQPNGKHFAGEAMCNILTLLHEGGLLIQITDETPELRMDFLYENINKCSKGRFSVSCTDIQSYYLYTIVKS